MGQVASRRRHYYPSSEMKKKRRMKKIPLEIWQQIKEVEINRLQETAKETEKEFERVKKKMICQSFLLKEIFEDTLKMQREHHDKEIAELKKEIAELKKRFENN
jgi:chromosome condensin MukBEF complex kleisin-like MukF subunit